LSRLGNFWEDVGPCTESTRELENQACKPANMKSWEMCQQVPGRTTMGPTRCVTTISGHCSWTTLVTCCLCVPTAVSTLHCLVCHTLSVDASGTSCGCQDKAHMTGSLQQQTYSFTPLEDKVPSTMPSGVLRRKLLCASLLSGSTWDVNPPSIQSIRAVYATCLIVT
jgi:hypothetical protein